MMTARWDRCVVQRGLEFQQFFETYLNCPDRKVLLIAGGGFDPRATMLAQTLSKLTRPSISAIVVREERAGSNPELRDRADRSTEELCRIIKDSSVVEIQVLASDNAPVGGREIVAALAKRDLSEFTDVVLDISALSTSIYFPAARFLYERTTQSKTANLHLVVAEEPTIDRGIRGIAHDVPGPLHGFRGRFGLDNSAGAAKLWLPQLIPGKRVALDRLHRRVGPAETCPILPFPSSEPRMADMLVEEYRDELIDAWEVDLRNCVYAAENDPLDLYRTTLRLNEARQRIFAEAGGSLLILSPTGSKILSVGALLAALECDLPVVLTESVAYEVRDIDAFYASLESLKSQSLVHVWLHTAAEQGKII
jgi:hypothetical protein